MSKKTIYCTLVASLPVLLWIALLVVHGQHAFKCRDKIEQPWPGKYDRSTINFEIYHQRQAYRNKSSGHLIEYTISQPYDIRRWIPYLENNHFLPWRLTPHAINTGLCANLLLTNRTRNLEECMKVCIDSAYCDVFYSDTVSEKDDGACWIGVWPTTHCTNPQHTSFFLCTFGSHDMLNAMMWLLLASFFLLETCALAVICKHMSSKYLCSLIQSIRFAVNAWRTALYKQCNRNDCSRLTKEVESARVKLAVRLMMPLLFLGTTYLPLHIWRIWKEVLGITNPPNEQARTRILLNSDAILTSFWMLVSLVALIRPSWQKGRFLDAAHISASAILGWQYASLQYRDYNYAEEWISFYRLLMPLVFGNLPLSLVLTIVLSCVHFICNTHVPDMPGNSWSAKVILHFLASSILICAVHISRYQRIAATLDAQGADASYRMAVRMIESMCDAVVQVDELWCITHKCPKLDLLLMRTQPLAVGEKFHDLLQESHQQAFEELLNTEQRAASSMESKSLARPFHAQLRGAYDTAVHLEMFAGCFEDTDGKYKYLLAFVDYAQDLDVAASLPTCVGSDRSEPGGIHTSALACDQAQGHRVDAPVALSPARLESSASRSSGSSGSSGSSERIRPFDDCEDAVSAWFDVSDTRLSILECSSGFMLLGGVNVIGASLAEWIDDPRSFVVSIQEHMNLLIYGDVEYLDALSLGEIRLRPPCMRQAAIEFVATCEIDSFASDEEATDFGVVRMLLRNLVQRRSKKHRHLNEPRRKARSRPCERLDETEPWARLKLCL